MNDSSQDVRNPRLVSGLLFATILIVVSVVASLVIREAGGSAMAAWLVAAAGSLAGALVMDRYSWRDGAVVFAMLLLLILGALPLLWVADRDVWLRENPLTFAAIIIIAAFMRHQYRKPGVLFAIAAILGGAHILISLL